MRYTITIQRVADEKRAKLLARAIQSKAKQFSFTELAAILQNEDFKVAHGVDKTTCDILKRQFEDIGVQYRIEITPEELVAPIEIPKHIEPTPIPATPQPQAVPAKLQPLHTEQKVEKGNERKSATFASILIIGAVVALFAFLSTQKSGHQKLEIDGMTFSKDGTLTPPSSEPIHRGESKKERQSRLYLDSADQSCVSGGSDSERLYRFALSFNRFNKNAWFGLLNCYRSSNLESDARKIEAEMVEIFGKEVLNPLTFPKDFCSIEAITLSGTTASMALHTKGNGPKIYSDLFQIVRRYAATGKFETLKILVKGKNGSGLFLVMPQISCISYDYFIKNANIEVIE